MSTSKNVFTLLLLGAVYYILMLYIQWDLSKSTANSKLQQSITNSKVKIISQNLWCHYLVKVGPNSYDRIKAFVSQVKDYDVVLIQEIFILRIGPFLFQGWATFTISEFKRYGFVYHTSFLESVPYLFGQNNGVAIFSKLPIIEAGTVIYEKSIFDFNLDYLNNKGFVWAKISLSKQNNLMFISTHLSAMLNGVDSEVTGHMIRIREINSISSFLNENKGNNFVLVGDFNTCSIRQKNEYTVLKNYLPTLTDIVSQRKLITYYDAFFGNETLDLIFLSKSLKHSLSKTVTLFTEKKQRISDHFGVTTDVQVEPV